MRVVEPFGRMISRVAAFFVFAGGAFGQVLPDFSLVDKNLTSPRSGEGVSPRDYLHQVTAYYFGAST